jgi:hypothetical protein
MPTSRSAPGDAFDLADQLGLISSEVLRFRIRNKAALDDDEKAQLEDLEMRLDKATAKVRAAGIAALGSVTAQARGEVQSATERAESLLRRIKRVQRALGIATAVLSLAVAAAAGQPQAILAALKGVKEAADDSAA